MVKQGIEDGGVSGKADVPDAMNVLNGIADLLAELLLIKLHLQKKQQEGLSNSHRFCFNIFDTFILYFFTDFQTSPLTTLLLN